MGNIIEVVNLKKVYKLYERNIHRLLEAVNFGRNSYYRDFYALNGVSFSVRKGSCTAIIGTNGSGKSTLLKIITGVLSQTDGECKVDGRISALLELGAGFNHEYTGIENIYLNGALMGISKNEMKERIPDIIEFADIGEFINQPVKNYSSGMFVRLAFAVAINVDPDILIVDEALSVGDAFFQLKCYKKFEDFIERGKTILFVTHDLNSVIRYCDYAVLLNKGKVVDKGAPKEIVDLYKKSLTTKSDTEDTAVVEDIDPTLWKSKLCTNPTAQEYGSKEAQIVDFGVFNKDNTLTATIEKNEKFTVRYKVAFNENVTDPIFAMTIKDVKGTEIAGTNTMFNDIVTGSFKKGDKIVVSFEQNMPLYGGPFFLSFAATHFTADGSLQVYHRLYDVLSIDVLTDKNNVGFIDLDTNISITENEDE